MKNLKKLFFSFFAMAALFFVTSPIDTHTPEAQAEKAREVVDSCCIMTVFVHGTVGPHFSFKAIGGWLGSLFKKKPKKISAFQQYIEQVKRHGFQRLQPINELGLHAISLAEEMKKDQIAYFGQQTAKLYQKVYDEMYPNSNDELLFYTFNWSGRLHKRSRRAAATDLYEAIYSEAKQLHEATGKLVKIWLLGHSHGANVILNLEDEESIQKKNLIVDKAIFFGGPVQTETEEFVNGHVFKNVYNIYSRGDHLQRLDCVSTKDWFSRQTFGSHKKKPVEVSNHVKQVEVKIGTCKPFHYELWLWGRKSFPHFLYRKRISIHPIPVSVFTPAIIAMVDQTQAPEQAADLYNFNIDGKKGRFDLSWAETRLDWEMDIQKLRDEGLKAL